MSELIVRKATENDVEGILKIEQLSFEKPWTKEMIQYDLAENQACTYIVAEFNGEIIGFVGFMSIVDTSEITNVAVNPLMRRQHIATILIDTLIQSTEDAGIKRWILEVRKNNASARRLYENHGFIVDSIRQDYYDNPKEDAVLMSRTL